MKQINPSRRGLTFSFPATGRFGIGAQYDYIIEVGSSPVIRIVPSEGGRYKMSRKKSGAEWRSLVDLRNKEVCEAIRGMEKLGIRITDDQITVFDAGEKVKARASKTPAILSFPRAALAGLRMASGMGDVRAVDALLDGAQITLDEWCASIGHCLSVPTVQKDLADVYTLVSLFSGAGILDWPFAQDSRFNIQYAIDYEASACKTYRNNIGTHIVHGDIHKAFTAEGYPLDATVSNPDVVIGGPSCKPFSNANRHTRLADHPDSDLVVRATCSATSL